MKNKLNCFLFTLLTVQLLVSCAGGNTEKRLLENINELNKFSTLPDESAGENFLVYASPEPKQNICKKASIVADKISINQLAKLLSETYDEKISYAISNFKKDNEQESIKYELSINMRNLCLHEIIEVLIDTYKIGITKNASGYMLHDALIQTVTYEVNYHNFNRQGSSAISIVNSQLSENDANKNYSTISAISEESFWQSIRDTIGSIINTEQISSNSSDNSATNQSFHIHKEAGLVVVNATPRQHSHIKNFLSKVNKNSVRQILIEAKILEVELNDQYSSGIQWDALRRTLYQSSFGGVNQAINTARDIHNQINLDSSQVADNAVVNSIRGNQKNDFNIVMQALNIQGKISVISSPRVSVLNNQRALIKSGEDKYFVTNVTNLTVDTNTQNATTQSGFNLEPIFSGVALDTTPNIISSSEILMHIHPMISRVNEERNTLTIDNRTTEIPVATIQSREVDTVVKAKSGNIIILGGMTQNYVNHSNSQLPFNSAKPIGKVLDLFSSKNNISRKVELIILIRPRIIDIFDTNNDLARYDYNASL